MRSRWAGFACGVLCCCFTSCGVRPPGRAETKTMYWIKRHVTVGGKAQSNPLAATKANIEAGKNAFGYYCVACHGKDGLNTDVPFAASMAPPVPSMASAEVQAYSDGQLKWVIEHGIFPSGMPASKGLLGDQEMWQIVRYLRTLPHTNPQGKH